MLYDVAAILLTECMCCRLLLCVFKLSHSGSMVDFQTRAQLLQTLTGDELVMAHGPGRHLLRRGFSARRGFTLFRRGGGGAVGWILVVFGALALAFILYSIWLRYKKHRIQQQQIPEGADQQQQVQQPSEQGVIKPTYPFPGGPATPADGSPYPTV